MSKSLQITLITLFTGFVIFMAGVSRNMSEGPIPQGFAPLYIMGIGVIVLLSIIAQNGAVEKKSFHIEPSENLKNSQPPSKPAALPYKRDS